jgi:hypothetical protein
LPATLQAQYFGASATLPAGANAETGMIFNEVDSQVGVTPVLIPSVAGVNFSFLKAVELAVTVTSSTTVNNRSVRVSTAFPAGMCVHWKTVTQANWSTSLDQTGGSKAPANTLGANNASSAPSGYTAVTTSAVQYDNTSQATSATGIASLPLLALVLAVDATYGGGPGTTALGSIILGFDEF